MPQRYLEIARNFSPDMGISTDSASNAAASDQVGFEQLDSSPVPILEYRSTVQARRCQVCGQGLSVVAVRDTCGRCVTPRPSASLGSASPSTEALARGEALIALDRRRYPRLTLPEGNKVGPGILNWAPVLREMDEVQLETLADQVGNSQPRKAEVVDE